MLFHQPIFNNTIGSTYLVRGDKHKLNGTEKIQLLLEDAAVILEEKDLQVLLKTISAARQSCTCNDKDGNQICSGIRFETSYCSVIFKSTQLNLSALENLIKRTMFELSLHSILSEQNIYS